MKLDVLTLQAGSGFVICVCGIIFILHTSFRAYDRSGLYWCFAFVGGILSTISFALLYATQSQLPLQLMANAAYVLSFGAFWSGARIFNGKAGRFSIPLVATVLTGIAVPLEWASAADWAGTAVTMACVGLFSLLAATEFYARRLRRSIHGRVLAVALGAEGLYALARSGYLALRGPAATAESPLFGSASAIAIVTLLLVACAISLAALRAEIGERGTARAVPAAEQRWRAFSRGVLSGDTFVEGALDRIARCNLHDAPMALLLAELDGLESYSIAYGREAGDDAILAFSRDLRGAVPPTALIGHLAAGRFAVLAVLDGVTEGRDISAAILSSLADKPLDASRGLRLSASIGVAQREGGAIDWHDLSAEAESALAKTRGSGEHNLPPGHIV